MREVGHGPARTVAACLLAAMAAMGMAGCAARAGAAAPGIEVAAAYVAAPVTPGTTVAYVVIRNNGPADRLLSAHTSVGGRVTFHVAEGPQATTTRMVPAVRIPAHGMLAMVPNGVQMIITGAGRMPAGKDITLTLVFARAGPVSVAAQVTNPQSGGSGYFIN